MDDYLEAHTPSEEAKEKAKAGGVELDDLKQTDPQGYKILNASLVVTVHPELLEHASGFFHAAFPRYELFQVEKESVTEMLSFPPLSKEEQLRFDEALGRMIAHPHYSSRHAYFRVVTVEDGERRELSLPLAPKSWQGEPNVMIGPFDSEEDARAWIQKGSTPYETDVLPQANAWFIDVFKI